MVCGFWILLLCGCSDSSKPLFIGTDITGIEVNDDVELIDYNGNETYIKDFKNYVLLMFFGFTSCPDICPTTLSKFSIVLDALGEKQNKVRTIFISLDPQRDKPEVLKSYVQSFNADFVGLTGSSIAVAKIARAYKIYFEKNILSEDSYTIDHFAGAYLIDHLGRPRVLISHNQPVMDIVKDIMQLIGDIKS